ncbi:hypothetical protein B566_EDAN019406, partial [Ephemera danica]
MIRPRGGDFLYSEFEYLVMQEDIKMAKKAKVDGVVLGILKKNGEVDLQKTKELVSLAFPLNVTFHRAIDVTPDPYEALESIIETGCERILTSGQQNKAIGGIQVIENLVKTANKRIEIMAGSGVNAENVGQFLAKNVGSVHLTGHTKIESIMEYRKLDVQMADTAGQSEFDLLFSGIGIGCMLATTAALAAEYSPNKTKDFWISFVISGYPIGAVISGLVAAKIIPSDGWQAMYKFAGKMGHNTIEKLPLKPLQPKGIALSVRLAPSGQSCSIALARKSATSILPFSSHFVTTTFMPAITAEAGFVPCADDGIKAIFLCKSPREA